MAELSEKQKQAQAAREADAKKLVEVVVDVEKHSHNGQPVKKGGTIKVTPSQRDWMAEHKLIKA